MLVGSDEDNHRTLAGEYAERYPCRVVVCDLDGTVRDGGAGPGDAGARAQAIAEAARFGEPVVVAGERDRFVWAVPLMHNARVLGGLCTGVAEADLFPEGLASSHFDVRRACRDLLELAVARNFCNEALLGERRAHHRREAQRASALHESKTTGGRALRDRYLAEEAALITAVRRGERGAAREIVNRALVGIYHHAAANRTLCKSLLLELVVMMVRGAVESGGDQTDLFSAQADLVRALDATRDEEELARWLRDAVERVFDAIERHGDDPSDLLLREALLAMEEGCTDPDFGRDEVATIAQMSPTALSRLIKKRTGRGFADHLNHLRIERARDLLRRTDLSLLHIALDCGFKDPSYFTKVFRRHVDMTPKDFRRRNRA